MSNVTREEIKSQVISVLSIISGFDESSIEEDQYLESDLGLNTDKRGSLASDFSDIIEKYNENNYMSMSECRSLQKVINCIDKVFEKSSWE